MLPQELAVIMSYGAAISRRLVTVETPSPLLPGPVATIQLPNINPIESTAVAENGSLNFIPSAERLFGVNQLRVLKMIPVFIRDGGKQRAIIEFHKDLLGSFRKKKSKVSFGQKTVFVPVDDRINRGHRKINRHGQGRNHDIDLIRSELRADQTCFGLKGQEDIPYIAGGKGRGRAAPAGIHDRHVGVKLFHELQGGRLAASRSVERIPVG